MKKYKRNLHLISKDKNQMDLNRTPIALIFSIIIEGINPIGQYSRRVYKNAIWAEGEVEECFEESEEKIVLSK